MQDIRASSRHDLSHVGGSVVVPSSSSGSQQMEEVVRWDSEGRCRRWRAGETPEKRSRRHTDTRQHSVLQRRIVVVLVTDVAVRGTSLFACWPLPGMMQRRQGGRGRSRGREACAQHVAACRTHLAPPTTASLCCCWALDLTNLLSLHGAPVLGSAANLTRSCCLARGQTLASSAAARPTLPILQ